MIFEQQNQKNFPEIFFSGKTLGKINIWEKNSMKKRFFWGKHFWKKNLSTSSNYT